MLQTVVVPQPKIRGTAQDINCQLLHFQGMNMNLFFEVEKHMLNRMLKNLLYKEQLSFLKINYVLQYVNVLFFVT